MSLLTETIAAITPQDTTFRARARERLEQLTMPFWALGRLMDLAEDLAGITRSLRPPIARKTIVTMAADHGVAVEGVSKYPQEVTAQMVHNFVNGGAGINALARQVGAENSVYYPLKISRVFIKSRSQRAYADLFSGRGRRGGCRNGKNRGNQRKLGRC